jgi:hypothetical protein
LESLVQGPYRVVENAGTTFRLQIGEDTVRVSSDRVTPAPRTEETSDEDDSDLPTRPPQEGVPVDRARPERQLTPESRSHSILRSPQSPSNPHRVRFRSPRSELPPSDEVREFEDREYVIDRVVDVDERGRFYRIRWLDYEENEDAWELSQPHWRASSHARLEERVSVKRGERDCMEGWGWRGRNVDVIRPDRRAVGVGCPTQWWGDGRTVY